MDDTIDFLLSTSRGKRRSHDFTRDL